MRFVSTRGDPSESFSLEDAIFSGYARDGGMYLPETIPEITPQQLKEWSVNYLNDTVGYSLFHQIAVDVLSLYIDEDDIPRNDLLEILQEGIDFPIRVTHFSPDSTTIRSDSAEFHPEKISWTQDSLHILELCNGPTFTFKDIGMQFLGRLMGYLLKKNNREKITIIVATSGDTGSAAIHAVENHPLIDLYVLYPGNNRISNLQERQMATNTANNIFCIRFDGSSDDADVVVTKLFKNENLKKYNLTTLNSVNIGRVLMQTVHFIFAYVQSLAPEIIRCVKNNEPLPPVRYCIPTGGLGNGSSCYLVKKMGIPIEKIIMAVNENDTISRTLESGTFKLNAVRVTNAPAMDICNPYNIERLLYLMSERDSNFVRNFIAKHDTDGGATLSEKVHQEFSRDFSSYSIPQTDVCKTIFSIFQKWGEIIDPHTAVGVTGSSRFNETNENSNSAVPLICVATAHPAKFPETIEDITKTPFVLPQALQNILEKPLRVTDLILDSMADTIGKMICDKYYRE